MINFPSSLVDEVQITKHLKDLFDEPSLAQLARSTGLIERSSSRLTGLSFLMLNVFQPGSAKETSLNDMCDYLEQEFGIVMAKQSLDERFNTHSCRFMKSCFEKTLRSTLGQVNFKGLAGKLNRLLLTDSTTFKLPEKLAVFYPGHGGAAGSSSIKLHYTYNLLSGSSEDLQLECGCKNDLPYRLKNCEVEHKDLVIRDLGYFNTSVFKQVAQAGAYYLSRYKTKTKLFVERDGEYQVLDIASVLPPQGKSANLEGVFIGIKNKLKTRLIIEAVPVKIKEERLKVLRKKSRGGKQWRVSQLRKDLAGFNIYLTNADKEVLPTKYIRSIYALRWQIELMFKAWKSLMELDKIKQFNIFRFECYLYGRLIAILLSQQIQNLFKVYLWETAEFELSEWKAYKLFKKV